MATYLYDNKQDKDGRLTMEEFKEGSKNDPTIVQALNLYDGLVQIHTPLTPRPPQVVILSGFPSLYISHSLLLLTTLIIEQYMYQIFFCFLLHKCTIPCSLDFARNLAPVTVSNYSARAKDGKASFSSIEETSPLAISASMHLSNTIHPVHHRPGRINVKLKGFFRGI